MALSLAACGGSSETVDITSDNAAAIATALTDANGTLHADVAAAIASGVDSVDITSDNAAAVTGALTGADGTVYADVAAAIAAGVTSVDITSDNATAITGALTGADGTVYADVAAAIAAGVTSVDITSDNATAATTALRNAAAELGVTGTSTMTDAELITAIKTANDTAIANGVDLTTDNVSAINSAVAAATTFTNLNDLVEAYEAAIAPAEVLNYVLAATADVISGGDSATVISGTAGTIDGDNINGGGGADTLNLTVTVADDDNAAFTTTSVETISIRSTGGTANDAAFVDLNFADASGVETLQLRRLGDDVEIDDLGDLSTTIELNNVATAADVNINYDAATVAGASDTVNVTIASSTGGGDLVINDVETIAVTVTGEDNDMNIDGDSIDSVTIGGAGDLNVDFDASVTTANASANTGGVTMNATAAADVTFTGGTGADTFAMGTTLTAADTLAGGDGADTLTLTGAAGAAIPASASVTGVETLRIETAAAGAGVATTLDANIVSFETITHDVSNAADTLTITDYTNETLNLVESAGNAIDLIDVTFVDATGASDALTINVTNSDAATAFTVDDIDSTGGGVETLNLVLNQGADIADASDILVDDVSSAHDTVNVSGDADATLGADAGLTAVTVSAAAATGDLTINLGAANQTVTGGSGADTFAFAGNLTSNDTVVGGTGEDAITAAMAAGVAAAAISGVEAATLEFGTAGASFSGANVDDLAAITIDAASDEAVVLTNLDATVADIRIGSTAANAAGDAATVRFATGTSSSHTLTIGDNTATPAADVDTGNVVVSGNAGALTLVSDAFTGNSIYSLAANDATSLTISTTENLEVDDNTGAGTLSATSATSASIVSAGGNLVVDGASDFAAATSIIVNGADGNVTLTGAVTATAMTTLEVNAAVGVTTTITGAVTSDADVTSVVLSASGSASDLSFDGLLDVDHVRTIDVTATGGANIDVADIELLGLDNDAATDIDTSLTLTANGEDASANASTITVAALNTAAATLDSVTVVTDADGVVSLTTGGANLTITTIDATGSAGTFTLDSSTISGAVTANFGTGTNNITTEADLQDTITLALEAGTDTLNIAAVSGTSEDVVTNFEVGANGDVVSLDVSAIDVGGDASGIVNQTGTDMGPTLTVIIEEDADGTLDATDTTNIIALTNIFADVAAVGDALGENLTVAAGVADDDDILVLWSDGASSYLSALAADWNTTAAGAGRTTEEENLVQFDGIVDVTTLTADNFVIV